jgi:schlafen family protein
MFTPPEVGTLEDQELDFKRRATGKDGKFDYLELAKDMAAMANAYGGTIVVGACEATKGTLSTYDPMEEKEAASVCNEYKTAQRDRLRPSVVVIPEVVPHEGGFLAAVRIEPSMGQAIGVRFIPKKDLDPTETKVIPEVYGFPVRVGDNTIWLLPEQLPMLMLPELRRTVLLLKKIGKEPVGLDKLLNNGTIDVGQHGRTIKAIAPDENAVYFEDDAPLALDSIVHVFHGEPTWRIRYRPGW